MDVYCRFASQIQSVTHTRTHTHTHTHKDSDSTQEPPPSFLKQSQADSQPDTAVAPRWENMRCFASGPKNITSASPLPREELDKWNLTRSPSCNSTKSLQGRASQVHAGKHTSFRGTIWKGLREKWGRRSRCWCPFREESRRDVMPKTLLGLLEEVCLSKSQGQRGKTQADKINEWSSSLCQQRLDWRCPSAQLLILSCSSGASRRRRWW